MVLKDVESWVLKWYVLDVDVKITLYIKVTY